jgi:phage protein D
MGDLADTRRFYTARPSLRLDGNAEPALSLALLNLVIRDSLQGIHACEATFGNWGTSEGGVGFTYFDRQTLELGRTLEVSIGDGEAAATVFHGRIMALEADFAPAAAPRVRVLAEDRLQDLRMTRRTRSFEDLSDGDIFEQIARDHGLSPDVDVDGEAHPVVVQLEESDLAFLRRRARAIGAELWLERDTLHVRGRARREGGELTLTIGQRLRSFSVRADLSHQRTRVAVGGWDPAAKEAIDEEATASVLQAELPGAGEVSGPALLEQAIGARAERLALPLSLSTEEARLLAQSAMRERARRFVTGSGEAEGDARLRVGAEVDVQGAGPLFEGAYTVVEALHLFDQEQGLRTRFRAERPWLGAA